MKWISDLKSCGVNDDWVNRLDILLNSTPLHDTLTDIVTSLRMGVSLTYEQGLMLWNHPNLSDVAHLANMCKVARFDYYVFFNSNLHINQTNICTLACKFCAFCRGRRAKDAYALSVEEFVGRIRPYANLFDEVHTVGGLHPDWDDDAAIPTLIKNNYSTFSAEDRVKLMNDWTNTKLHTYLEYKYDLS